MPNTPFVTQQDLSDRLGRDVTTDAGALSAVQAACDICRDIAEQDFTAGTATISLDGSGTDALVLPQWPVGTVSAVTVNGGTITDFCWSDNGLLLRGAAGNGGNGWNGWNGWCRPLWPRGRQNVSVTYQHGYGTADIPASIREVALGIAMRLVVQGVAQSETIADVTLNYGMAASDLTANELRILRRHRRPRSF